MDVNQTMISHRIVALEDILAKEFFYSAGSIIVITAIAERQVASAKNIAEEINTTKHHLMTDRHESGS